MSGFARAKTAISRPPAKDAKGRKQYRYHPKWRETADANKYGRVMAFAAALPGIRKRIEADMGKPGLPREKVLATVVKLLETTLIRVGNEEYAKTNKHYGLTTMRNRHVKVEGGTFGIHLSGQERDRSQHRTAKPPAGARGAALPGIAGARSVPIPR